MDAKLGNQFLEANTYAYRLCNAQNWYNFTTKEPVGMFHLTGNTFLVTGKNHSVDLIELLDGGGFKHMFNLNTEGNEVNAACLLHGAQPGISMIDEREEEDKDVTTVILGCSNGYLYRFANEGFGGDWSKTGELKLTTNITDVL